MAIRAFTVDGRIASGSGAGAYTADTANAVPLFSRYDYGTQGISTYHILALVIHVRQLGRLNQAELTKMVERVDWKDAISGGSTLREQAPEIVATPKFSRPPNCG